MGHPLLTCQTYRTVPRSELDVTDIDKPYRVVIHHIVDGRDQKRRLNFATRAEAFEAQEKLTQGQRVKWARLAEGEWAEVVMPLFEECEIYNERCDLHDAEPCP